MSDFGVNFPKKPVIKESQSTHDGGAGNLGYFEREENKKRKERDSSIFSEVGEDTFGDGHKDPKYPDDFSISKLIAEIIFTVKNWLKKTFNIQ